jgi:hypothetical protein
MKTAYRVFAYLVAAEVVVQAMLIAWAVAGLGKWVNGGGVFDKSVMESEETPFPEVLGVPLHGLNGMFVIPVIALVLLILSFFTKLRGASKWAGLLFALVIVQGQLGFLGHEAPIAGAVHGFNALLLFSVAVYTARRVRAAASSSVERPEARVSAPV